MPDIRSFIDAMKKNMVSEEVIERIKNVGYPKSDILTQDNANYFTKALPLCEKLLSFDLTAKIMYDRSCCRSGYRLNNAKKLNDSYYHGILTEKLELHSKMRHI